MNKYTAEELVGIIEKSLPGFIQDKNKYNKTLIEAELYSLGSGGKRLRPLLLLASCQYASGDIERAVPFACAIEYIHSYSLIHDDLPCMDDDDFRRGKPSSHKVYGEAMALLAGDSLLTTAFKIMADAAAREADEDSAKAMFIISDCAERMIEGQVADISCSENCSEKDIAFVHENKTGALFYAAMTAGAILGGASKKKLAAVECFAKNYGLAFQLADDINDFDKEGELNYARIYGKEIALRKFNKYINAAYDAVKGTRGSEILLSAAEYLRNTVNE